MWDMSTSHGDADEQKKKPERKVFTLKVEIRLNQFNKARTGLLKDSHNIPTNSLEKKSKNILHSPSEKMLSTQQYSQQEENYQEFKTEQQRGCNNHKNKSNLSKQTILKN